MALSEMLTAGFVKELLAYAMDNRSTMEVAITHMKFQYLQTDVEKTVWKALTKFYKKYRKAPSYGVLSQQVADSAEAIEWLAEVEEIELDENRDSLIDQFQEYLRQMMFLDANERIVETFNRGNRDDSYKLFTDMATKMQQFSIVGHSFEQVFGGFLERHRHRLLGDDGLRFRIPTGIDELDYRMGGKNGGLESGDAMLILGGSGSGKSQALIHIGLTAARLGFNVVHFQLEGTRDQCLNRYDAAWTGVISQEIRAGQIDPKRMQMLERIVKSKNRRDIYIEAKEEYGGLSLPEARRSLKELRRIIGDIHMVVFDYLDLMTPGDGVTYGPDHERHRQTKIARGMKEIAMEFNAVVVTGTQSSDVKEELRNDPKFHLSRNNLAEDRGKIRPFDVLVTLNQTDDERRANVMRLWVDKFRDYRNEPTPIFICTNFDHSRFYDRTKTAELEENIPRVTKRSPIIK